MARSKKSKLPAMYFCLIAAFLFFFLSNMFEKSDTPAHKAVEEHAPEAVAEALGVKKEKPKKDSVVIDYQKYVDSLEKYMVLSPKEMHTIKSDGHTIAARLSSKDGKTVLWVTGKPAGQKFLFVVPADSTLNINDTVFVTVDISRRSIPWMLIEGKGQTFSYERAMKNKDFKTTLASGHTLQFGVLELASVLEDLEPEADSDIKIVEGAMEEFEVEQLFKNFPEKLQVMLPEESFDDGVFGSI